MCSSQHPLGELLLWLERHLELDSACVEQNSVIIAGFEPMTFRLISTAGVEGFFRAFLPGAVSEEHVSVAPEEMWGGGAGRRADEADLVPSGEGSAPRLNFH